MTTMLPSTILRTLDYRTYDSLCPMFSHSLRIDSIIITVFCNIIIIILFPLDVCKGDVKMYRCGSLLLGLLDNSYIVLCEQTVCFRTEYKTMCDCFQRGIDLHHSQLGRRTINVELSARGKKKNAVGRTRARVKAYKKAPNANVSTNEKSPDP